ncbi:MAG TPA: biotin/lipoyl-binding protein, partial [Thermoanaerobaculia bacterium]|nr:biotin/lipoyl-binding protein [Thermoanaerobaculia bacterium]
MAVVLLAAWGWWFFGARLAVFAVSSAARLEVAGAARPVEAPVAGRLAEARASLGQTVAAGEVLFVLDPAALAEEATAARQRLDALAERRAALADELG